MKASDRYEYSTPSMGTTLKIVVYADSDTQAQDCIDRALASIDALIPILNNYDPTSEVSRLSGGEGGRTVAVSPDLARVLEASKRWSDLSEGSFDVTLGPIFRLWANARRSKTLPTSDEIQQAMQCVGWQQVKWVPVMSEDAPEPTGGVLQCLAPNMRVDTSGLATGYIIDRAFEALTSEGTQRALIDVGGDIRVGAPPPESEGWKIDVAGFHSGASTLRRLQLAHCAITTSGDLHQFMEIGGVRYGHLIDPATGFPIPRRQSATVIAPLALDADAGATALSVLGIERSCALFESMPITEAILLESGLERETLDHVRYRRLVVRDGETVP